MGLNALEIGWAVRDAFLRRNMVESKMLKCFNLEVKWGVEMEMTSAPEFANCLARFF